MSQEQGNPTVVQPPGWPRPIGYSNGMKIPAGSDLIVVAGQVGWDTEERFPGTFIEQWRQALSNVMAVVEAGGGTGASLASMTIYVTDKKDYLEDLKAVGTVWKEVIGRHFPAMALVEVAALVEDEAMVEVQALASVKGAE